MSFSDGSYARAWSLIPLALISLFVFYLAWQNTFFSSEWWLLPIRDIDDYAMQLSAAEMRFHLQEGDWQKSFSFFHYAYGFGWWLLAALLTIPGALIESTETTIILGRMSSLLAVLGTATFVARIGCIVGPEKKTLWLWILLLGLATPLSVINSTKMIVAGWSALLTVLGVYLAARAKLSNPKAFIIPSAVTGAAIGFKLVAVAALPIFLAIVWWGSKESRLRRTVTSVLTVVLSSIAVGAPSLLAALHDPDHARRIVSTFETFRDMGTYQGIPALNRLHGGIEHFGSTFVIVALWVAVVILGFISRDTLAKALYFSVASCVFLSWLGLIVIMEKPGIYMAVYALNVMVFLPLGLTLLTRNGIRRGVSTVSATLVIAANVFLSTRMLPVLFTEFNYFSLYHSEVVSQKIKAAQEIKRLVSLSAEPPSVLQDSKAVFPGSILDGTAEISMIYGNLEDYTDKSDLYDFIVFRRNDYYGRPDLTEESLRKKLETTGHFGSSKFVKLSDFNDIVLFAKE